VNKDILEAATALMNLEDPTIESVRESLGAGYISGISVAREIDNQIIKLTYLATIAEMVNYPDHMIRKKCAKRVKAVRKALGYTMP